MTFILGKDIHSGDQLFRIDYQLIEKAEKPIRHDLDVFAGKDICSIFEMKQQLIRRNDRQSDWVVRSVANHNIIQKQMIGFSREAPTSGGKIFKDNQRVEQFAQGCCTLNCRKPHMLMSNQL